MVRTTSTVPMFLSHIFLQPYCISGVGLRPMCMVQGGGGTVYARPTVLITVLTDTSTRRAYAPPLSLVYVWYKGGGGVYA